LKILFCKHNAFFFSFIFCSFAGELHFETNIRKVTVSPDAREIEMLFPFENKTSEVVEIRKYDAPCSCMSAKLKGGKQVESGAIAFAPGERGVIKGIFELGNFKGTITKKIVVWTSKDSDEKPSIGLITKVTVPALVSATPTSLIWEVGSNTDTKEISIKMKGTEPIKILSQDSSSENIEYEVVTVKEGFEYLIKVTPKSTDKVTFAALRFRTDSKVERFKTLQTFMTIKPKN